MRRVLLIAILAGTLAGGCGTTPVTPSPWPSPTASLRPIMPSGPPDIACLGGVTQSDCDGVARVALEAVVASGWTPVQVWVNSGFFCPDISCLFDPMGTSPYPSPPDGSTWLANAEIAFAETDHHAGLHVATRGSTYVPVLIGYRVPLPGWCSGQCP